MPRWVKKRDYKYRRPRSTPRWRRSRSSVYSRYREAFKPYKPAFGANVKLPRLVRGYTQRRRQRQSSRNLLAETKLLPTTVYNETPGIPIVTGALACYKGFVLQSIPTGWDSNLLTLSGIDVAQGVTGSTRIGNYVFYKRTHLSLQVDMNSLVYQAPPIEFRFVVAKSRQAVMPAGSTDQPQYTLFLDPVGSQIGYQTTGFNGADMMLQPLNKRDWVIFRDQKFTLSSPMMTDSDGGGVGYSGKYACRKNLRVNLNHFRKTRLSSSNLPQDYDAHYLVYIFASCIGKDHVASNWEVSTRGTTSFMDT